ncbi:hypothetical protein DFH29DRAFT_41790 [Suillus ampliporus]|nr:hypothetical protein DFH29DRAFT_41790 [Suillus ampliporus]
MHSRIDMHHCLRLTEILEVIFNFVFKSSTIIIFYSLPGVFPSSYTQDRRSVLNLALTCRAFRDPALNVLYSHLRDIQPLMSLISLLDETRPPVHTPKQFRSLVLCAARVQTLFVPYSNNTSYTFLLASAPKDALLFPKLRSLKWHDWRLTSIPTLNLFLPTLETLSLDVSNTPFCKAIISELYTAAPHLKALEFVGKVITIRDGLSEIESLLFSYPEGLTELSIPCCHISSGLLNVIAAWPRLQWLTFHLSFKSIPTVPCHVSQAFQALTHLHISCKDLRLFISFLHAFRILRMDSDTCSFGYPNLKTIQINARGCSPASIWSELLSLLTRTKLEHIILTEKCYCYNVKSRTAPPSFDFHTLLAHPTALADLKTLVLSPDHTSSIALTDTDILMLARTCPYLVVLDLGVRNTPVSLCALGILVRRCHELREVMLCVDAPLGALAAMALKKIEWVYNLTDA